MVVFHTLPSLTHIIFQTPIPWSMYTKVYGRVATSACTHVGTHVPVFSHTRFPLLHTQRHVYLGVQIPKCHSTEEWLQLDSLKKELEF